MHYFDNAATTYPKPNEVYEALDYANRNLAFNAGRGNYDVAKRCCDIIKNTREKLAKINNVDYRNVTFMSSATEALNLIISGIEFNEGDYVYYSPFKHNSIIRPLFHVADMKKINLKIIPFNEKTLELDADTTQNEFALCPPKAVFLSHVSNVVGNILPYELIFELSKKYNSINVLDCAQSYGIVNPNIINTDFIVFAGHKSLYASFGVAGFINVNNIKLNIVKSGGNGSDSLNKNMPSSYYERYESGTPNIVAIYSLNVSLDWLLNNNIHNHELKLVEYFIDKIQDNKKIILHTIEDQKAKTGIISFNVIGYKASEVGEILSDEFGICLRTGYHCSPLIHDLLNTHEFGGTVRLSFGAFNTFDEVDLLVEALETL